MNGFGCEPVGDDVFELRIDTGPGSRIYLGIDGEQAILLGEGDKRSQMGDILKAKDCWRDYHAETDECISRGSAGGPE